MSSSGSAATPAEPTPEEQDPAALAKAKPLLVYYYVNTSKANDSSYQFAQKFELSILSVGDVVDLINKKFDAKKIGIDPETDRKDPKNNARIEIWSATKQKIGVITPENDGILTKAGFCVFLNARVAKNEKMVKDEIARIEKAKAEAARKESAAK